MRTSIAEVSDGITESLRDVTTNAQELLDAMRKEGADKYGETFHRLQSNVDRARERLESGARRQARRMRHAARVADETMHEHPWAAAGTAMTIGAMAGALAVFFLTRR